MPPLPEDLVAAPAAPPAPSPAAQARSPAGITVLGHELSPAAQLGVVTLFAAA